MTVLHEPPSTATVENRTPLSWWRLPEIWGTLAIIVMWLAVLFDVVYGPDMRFTDTTNGSSTVLPSGVVVAICAAFATASVAKRAFRRG